ncbi:dihydropteroate synthase [Rhizobacter sp. J219]|nr:dihydropteroate synthase [Rhizobacter sp. J219]MCR5882662.1 dihydropteroate synthase [Rhizobacter sp. J219]
MIWQTTRFRIDLSRPRVMGIVNITPDSFSDGGRHATTQAAVAYCEQLLKEGADMLDLGGESSRPGAEPLPLEEEQARVLPVLREALKLGVPVSVDTYKPETMRAALELGADIVNDIYALRWPGAVEAVAAHPGCGVCLMHMQGEPMSMQQRPIYGDVLDEVGRFLRDRAALLEQAGVQRERITLDPGIGFGKTVEHNVALLARQRELLGLGYPLLIGWSRKSSLGVLTGRPVEQRQAASLAAALAAAVRGAKVLRVHDVAATVDALKVGEAAGLWP